MNIICCYVYPHDGAGHYRDLALNFIHGHNYYTPGVPHRTVVVCNGCEPSKDAKLIFSDIEHCELCSHDNTGFDIGAYQKCAREYPCDLMVFFGASTYFRKAGWLVRMRDSYIKFGRNLYGAMAHAGGPINAHIRTTGFWMHPDLLNTYPHRITQPHERYPFEHGPENITDWCLKSGGAPIAVTFAGEYFLMSWHDIPGGYHNGNQEHMIVGDRMSRPPYYPVI